VPRCSECNRRQVPTGSGVYDVVGGRRVQSAAAAAGFTLVGHQLRKPMSWGRRPRAAPMTKTPYNGARLSEGRRGGRRESQLFDRSMMMACTHVRKRFCLYNVTKTATGRATAQGLGACFISMPIPRRLMESAKKRRLRFGINRFYCLSSYNCGCSD
jgi:hypothetical protein